MSTAAQTSSTARTIAAPASDAESPIAELKPVVEMRGMAHARSGIVPPERLGAEVLHAEGRAGRLGRHVRDRPGVAAKCPTDESEL